MSIPDMAWTTEKLPRLDGKTVVITGANSGIGYEAALALAGTGARLVLACRSREKTEEAIGTIKAAHPAASLSFMELDLASLGSIRAFAGAFIAAHPRLDILINNAGIMAIPRRETADGFEMQLGTNHLGHYALTGLLLDRVLASAPARIVTVSSDFHRFGKMRFSDLQGQKRYRKWSAYSQSKLANLLFAYELQRRINKVHPGVKSIACHPGYAATNLQSAGPRMENSRTGAWMMRAANRLFSQPAHMGALPTLYAAAAPEAQGGDYIGPDGFQSLGGYPRKVKSNRRSYDEGDAKTLWQLSEELTGVRFAALAR